MQDRHKVRVCISVVQFLADEIKYLSGTFGVYVYLEGEKKRKTTSQCLQHVKHSKQEGKDFYGSYRLKAF